MGAYSKAIVGVITAFLGGLYEAMTDDRVTGLEWVAIAILCVAVFGSVFGVPNTVGSVRRTPPNEG